MNKRSVIANLVIAKTNWCLGKLDAHLFGLLDDPISHIEDSLDQSGWLLVLTQSISSARWHRYHGALWYLPNARVSTIIDRVSSHIGSISRDVHPLKSENWRDCSVYQQLNIRKVRHFSQQGHMYRAQSTYRVGAGCQQSERRPYQLKIDDEVIWGRSYIVRVRPYCCFIFEITSGVFSLSNICCTSPFRNKFSFDTASSNRSNCSGPFNPINRLFFF